MQQVAVIVVEAAAVEKTELVVSIFKVNFENEV